MIKIIYMLLFLFACTFLSPAFAQKLVFDYDAAGNQVSREWVCVNCGTSQMTAEAAAMADTIQETDPNFLLEDKVSTEGSLDSATIFQDARTVSVYPNPVSETLQVRWASDLDIPVNEIYLTSTSGVLLLRRTISPSQHEISISFSGYPPGSYWLRAIFTDGRWESIMVIKVD